MSLFKRKYKPVFITTKSAFTVTLIVITLTIFIVWQQGLHLERSVLRNSLLSTSILSSFLFLFILIGLYKGFKLKDNLGKITDSFKTNTDKKFLDWIPSFEDGMDFGDGCAEVFIWILVSIALTILLFIFGTIIWFSILLLLAILYWIFFRALRLVFKCSPMCQGNLILSARYAFSYTALSTLWLIILLFFLEHQNYTLVAFAVLFDS